MELKLAFQGDFCTIGEIVNQKICNFAQKVLKKDDKTLDIVKGLDQNAKKNSCQFHLQQKMKNFPWEKINKKMATTITLLHVNFGKKNGKKRFVFFPL